MEQPVEGWFLDVATERRINDRTAMEIIKKICKKRDISQIQTLSQEKQMEYIKKIYDEGSFIRQLARLTGITKGRIEKIFK